LIKIANRTGQLQQNEKAEGENPDLHHDPYTLQFLFVVGYIIRRWTLLPCPPKYMDRYVLEWVVGKSESVAQPKQLYLLEMQTFASTPRSVAKQKPSPQLLNSADCS